MSFARLQRRVMVDRSVSSRAAVSSQFFRVVARNGATTTPLIKLCDGYAIDTSMSLLHLGRLLENRRNSIRERSGVRRPIGHIAAIELTEEGDTEKYPSRSTRDFHHVFRLSQITRCVFRDVEYSVEFALLNWRRNMAISEPNTP